jgi:hypothetical protein
MATAQAICVCGKCAPGWHVIPVFDVAPTAVFD